MEHANSVCSTQIAHKIWSNLAHIWNP